MSKALLTFACLSVLSWPLNTAQAAADNQIEGGAGDVINRIQTSADCKPSFFKGCPPVSVISVPPEEWWPELKKAAVWAIKRNPGAEVDSDPTIEAGKRLQRIFEKWCEESNGSIRDQSLSALRLMTFRSEFPQQYTLRNSRRCNHRIGQPAVIFSMVEFLEKYTEPLRPIPSFGGSSKDDLDYVRQYNKEHANLPIRYLVIQSEDDLKSAEAVSRNAEVEFNQACRDGDPKLLNMSDCQVLRKMDSYQQQGQKPAIIKGTL